MEASLASLEDEFIVSVCSGAIMSRGSTTGDMSVSVTSGGLVLRYDSFDELVFVLLNLSLTACGEA